MPVEGRRLHGIDFSEETLSIHRDRRNNANETGKNSGNIKK